MRALARVEAAGHCADVLGDGAGGGCPLACMGGQARQRIGGIGQGRPRCGSRIDTGAQCVTHGRPGFGRVKRLPR